jgi:hypothetical protein
MWTAVGTFLKYNAAKSSLADSRGFRELLHQLNQGSYMTQCPAFLNTWKRPGGLGNEPHQNPDKGNSVGL